MHPLEPGLDPIAAFIEWFEEAQATGSKLPHAMTLATVGLDGGPVARMVLLKGVDPTGFTFFTNYQSNKGGEIDRDPRVALVFYWSDLDRQVRVRGSAQRLPEADTAAYWATRPRGSQIGAWASRQSQALTDRAEIEGRVAGLVTRYEGADIPVPAHWGGYRVVPTEIEFWIGRPDRLHDRFLYVSRGDTWTRTRLQP